MAKKKSKDYKRSFERFAGIAAENKPSESRPYPQWLQREIAAKAIKREAEEAQRAAEAAEARERRRRDGIEKEAHIREAAKAAADVILRHKRGENPSRWSRIINALIQEEWTIVPYKVEERRIPNLGYAEGYQDIDTKYTSYHGSGLKFDQNGNVYVMRREEEGGTRCINQEIIDGGGIGFVDGIVGREFAALADWDTRLAALVRTETRPY